MSLFHLLLQARKINGLASLIGNPNFGDLQKDKENEKVN